MRERDLEGEKQVETVELKCPTFRKILKSHERREETILTLTDI